MCALRWGTNLGVKFLSCNVCIGLALVGIVKQPTKVAEFI